MSNGQLLRNNEDGNVVEYNNRFDSIPELEFVVFDFSDPMESFFQVPYRALPPTGLEGAYPGPASRLTRTLETSVGSVDAFGFSFGDISGSYVMEFGRGVGLLESSTGSDQPGGETWVLIHAFIGGTTVIKTSVQSQSWGAVKMLKKRIVP